MDRQQLAYLLIILMALAIAFVAAFRWHHSHDRTYLRQRRQEAEDHDRHMAARVETPSD
ncbi:MAG TPA: hypothetical protein VLK25_03340 [Allosphingosinicella sp.]|nr:hypothetical protein [Allosphingosinicella sp.]